MPTPQFVRSAATVYRRATGRWPTATGLGEYAAFIVAAVAVIMFLDRVA
jgi:hypothetical protein